MSENLIRLPRLQARVPLCRSEIYRLMKLGRFPKPIKLGERSVAWREADVDAWIANRIKQTAE